MNNTFSRRFLNTVSFVVLSVSLIVPSFDADARSVRSSSRSRVHAPKRVHAAKSNKRARSVRQSRVSRKVVRTRSSRGNRKGGRSNVAALQAAQAHQLAALRVQQEQERLAREATRQRIEREGAERLAALRVQQEQNRLAREATLQRIEREGEERLAALRAQHEQNRLAREEENARAAAQRQAEQLAALRVQQEQERLDREEATRQRLAREVEILQRLAREREQAAREEQIRQGLANFLANQRQEQERERLAAVQRAQEEQEQVLRAEAARLEEERQREANIRVPVVAAGQEGLTIAALLDQLKQTQRLHGVFLFLRQNHLENFTEDHRKIIIDHVEQKRRNGLIKNKEEAILALQEEAIKIRCSTFLEEQQDRLKRICMTERRQPRDNELLLNKAGKEKCLEHAIALFTSGKIKNFKGTVDGALTILSLQKTYKIDEEEAASLGHFIRTSKVQDQNLAKYYHDLAEELYLTRDIGPSTEQNRELLALILENEVTNEPAKLSTVQNENWIYTERQDYAIRHLRGILNSASTDLYFQRLGESLEKKELADLFQNEKKLRNDNQETIFDRINTEKTRCILKYTNKNDYGSTNHTLENDTNNLIITYYNLDDFFRGQQTKFNFEYFYQDPYLVYLLDADKNLPQGVVTQEEMNNLCNDLINRFRGAYGDQPLYWEYEANIRNALLTQIDVCPDVTRRNSMRARMMRAVQCMTVKDDAIIKDPLLAFARKISKNDRSRCIDGINEWLTAFEMKRVYKAPKDAGFPVIVSSLLNQEKMKFVSAHRPQEQDEIATEGPALLKQRMRLGFGLPLPFSPVLYGSMAGTSGRTADIYDPVLVLERFFKGGSLTFRYDVFVPEMINGIRQIIAIPKHCGPLHFQPFTVDRFINLVRTAWLNEELRDDILTTEIQKDWVLKKASERVFEGAAGNEDMYFKNVMEKEQKYKPSVFKRLLCRAGFLIDDSEPAFEYR